MYHKLSHLLIQTTVDSGAEQSEKILYLPVLKNNRFMTHVGYNFRTNTCKCSTQKNGEILGVQIVAPKIPKVGNFQSKISYLKKTICNKRNFFRQVKLYWQLYTPQSPSNYSTEQKIHGRTKFQFCRTFCQNGKFFTFNFCIFVTKIFR